MEQLEQLKTMRDDAATRLEAARAAIEVSPDAKLFNSLSSLISDLEEALGVGEDAAPSKEKKGKAAAAPELEAETPTPLKDLAEEAKSDEMSLEESLEAELLADNGELPNGKTASSL